MINLPPNTLAHGYGLGLYAHSPVILAVKVNRRKGSVSLAGHTLQEDTP